MSSAIAFHGVSKLYSHKKKIEMHALKHVNLTIEKGDIFGIIGPSGAGKSTLLRCMATLEKPSMGQIYIGETEVTHQDPASLRKIRMKLGVIFPQFNLFSSRTVWENVSYPLEVAGIEKEERGRRISELLGLVGLSDKRDVYPAMLSHGQKQRVGIARALANNPEILLCDEATSALDPKTREEILFLIQDLQKKLGFTVVVITHEMDVIKQICNKVAVLEKGEIVECGTIQEVFTLPKHPKTKELVEKRIHEIPSHLISGKGRVFHLHFAGKKTDQPVITQMAKKFDVDANILLGWIDSLQTVTVGNLIIELTGEGIEKAIPYLEQQGIKVEERHD